ncbi:hypothetical protein F0562_023406 [Nyssa sinensis]|uniref:Uncharacterized protein n=1 Tax=Nyssa sinensis TaxID=561372 RepID=A0A5J5BIK8_9ASTE|nr:hypothetical protein F0562_023406 [Nyssa sinensis]
MQFRHSSLSYNMDSQAEQNIARIMLSDIVTLLISLVINSILRDTIVRYSYFVDFSGDKFHFARHNLYSITCIGI